MFVCPMLTVNNCLLDYLREDSKNVGNRYVNILLRFYRAVEDVIHSDVLPLSEERKNFFLKRPLLNECYHGKRLTFSDEVEKALGITNSFVSFHLGIIIGLCQWGFYYPEKQKEIFKDAEIRIKMLEDLAELGLRLSKECKTDYSWYNKNKRWKFKFAEKYLLFPVPNFTDVYYEIVSKSRKYILSGFTKQEIEYSSASEEYISYLYGLATSQIIACGTDRTEYFEYVNTARFLIRSDIKDGFYEKDPYFWVNYVNPHLKRIEMFWYLEPKFGRNILEDKVRG